MSFKTYVIIFLTVAITIIFMQNLEPVVFNVLWMTFPVSKLIMMLIVTVFGFTLGVIVARPRKKKLADSAINNLPFEDDELTEADNDLTLQQKRNLSDEDRDYIN